MRQFPLYAPDGAQGGDPMSLNPDTVNLIFAERVLGINKTDTLEINPKYPDSKRYLNYPEMDNSPLNPPYAGCTSLRQLGEKTAKLLADEHKKAKDAGIQHQARFLGSSFTVKDEIVNLRIFSFNQLSEPLLADGTPNPAYSAIGSVTAGITRKDRVTLRSANIVSYGRTIRDDAPKPAEAQTEVKQEVKAENAKPAVV